LLSIGVEVSFFPAVLSRVDLFHGPHKLLFRSGGLKMHQLWRHGGDQNQRSLALENAPYPA
jgi:hypothetical protein